MQTTLNGNYPASDGKAPTAEASIRDKGDEVNKRYTEADLISRVRDRRGNRLGWSHSWAVPAIDGVTLVETPLARSMDVLAEVDPATTAHLHHFYDHRLRASLRRLHEARAEEESDFTDYNNRVTTRNGDIDRDVEVARRALAEAREPLDSNVRSVEDELVIRRQAASEALSRMGRSFDPAVPDPLRLEPERLESVAAELQMPWVDDDQRAVLTAFWSWATTLLIGAMMGLSIGIMAGILPVDDLFGKPSLAIACSLVGIAAAVLGKSFIKLSQREASQRYWLGQSPKTWLGFAVIAVLVDLAILLIDCHVEREGLLANMRLQQQTMALSTQAAANHLDEWGYLLAAILLSFGYVGTNAWEGYLCGRHAACLNRCLQRQQEKLQSGQEALRQDPLTQPAVLALAHVNCLTHRRTELEGMLADLTQATEAQVQTLETARVQPSESLPTESRLRIQDALDDVHGAQLMFDAMLDASLGGRQPISSHRPWWLRLFAPRRLGRYQPKRESTSRSG